MKLPDIPKDLRDPRDHRQQREDAALADQYAPKGSVKHFMLSLGFMPNNEEDAKAIVARLIREREWLESFIEALPEPGSQL